MTNTINKTLDCTLLGPNLKKLRMDKKMSREAFAEKIGVSTRIIYDYEEGFKTPSLVTFITIARVLGVSMDSILQPM